MAVGIFRIRATNQFPNSRAGAASFSVETAIDRSIAIESGNIDRDIATATAIHPKTDTVPRT
ncbi:MULTISPECIES: hypothetical protein [unclassified Microcoleus]|uniref:hypothetical protein n=1 Tax=unclassified Microcoleus TaxID=2642155 RepID=UPI0025CC9952|nr:MULTISPECIES: hypothetical protein [unclassified Microcoleus]